MTQLRLWIGQTAAMAFGQQSGPPASTKQVQELLSLLHDAGHRDFKDARGPMGFNQRQAGGRFTRDEADSYIDQLQQEAPDGSPPPASVAAPKPSIDDRALRRMPAPLLATELERRGWIVIGP